MSGMLGAMGRGTGEPLDTRFEQTWAPPRRPSAAGLLWGPLHDARPLCLDHRPDLGLQLPDRPRMDRITLRNIIKCVSLFHLAPVDPAQIDPISYLHLRIRRQIEELRSDTDAPASPLEEITFSSSEMACLKLPAGRLRGFELSWNEWDMIMGAISWACRESKDTKGKKNEDHAILYRALLDEDPALRDGRISCVRCGHAMQIEEAMAEPRAYRCPACPSVD